TWFLINMIKRLKKQGERILVVDPDGAEDAWDDKSFKRYDDISDVPDDFTGVAVVMYAEPKSQDETPTFPYIVSKLDKRKNKGVRGPWAGSFIILDDANVYAEGSIEPALRYL